MKTKPITLTQNFSVTVEDGYFIRSCVCPKCPLKPYMYGHCLFTCKVENLNVEVEVKEISKDPDVYERYFRLTGFCTVRVSKDELEAATDLLVKARRGEIKPDWLAARFEAAPTGKGKESRDGVVDAN